MKCVIAVVLCALCAGCATTAVSTVLGQVKEQRDNEVTIRYAAFCAMPADAALRRFRSSDNRVAFIQLCDVDPGQ